MSDARSIRAARLLADHRLGHSVLERLPDELAPNDESEAYAVQDVLHTLLHTSGMGEVAGYKIGCTTAVMQRYLGISQPVAGAIFATSVYRRAARLRHAEYVRPGVECELAVQLARDLPDEESSLRDSVAGVMLAIEIVDDRYRDWTSIGTPTLIADDFFGAGCVLGDSFGSGQLPPLGAISATMLVNDRAVGAGSGNEILGEPLAALAWLADSLA